MPQHVSDVMTAPRGRPVGPGSGSRGIGACRRPVAAFDPVAAGDPVRSADAEGRWSAVTTHTDDKLMIRRPESGWSKARRRWGKGVVRTCIPAVVDEGTTRTDQPGPDGNIVRGED